MKTKKPNEKNLSHSAERKTPADSANLIKACLYNTHARFTESALATNL